MANAFDDDQENKHPNIKMEDGVLNRDDDDGEDE